MFLQRAAAGRGAALIKLMGFESLGGHYLIVDKMNTLTILMWLFLIATALLRCRRNRISELDATIRYLRTHDKMGKTVEQLREEVLNHLKQQ